MTPSPYQILLTNDDGIQSPGIWAAAEALSSLGYVTVVAPREQSSATGRSMPLQSDGIIRRQTIQVHHQEWSVYSVGGTPAQTVLYGILDVMPTRPDLVVSGINYGENVGNGVTISGTVGAAIEAAAQGIPALAVSLQTDAEYFYTYSAEVEFATAGSFTARFARMLLEKQLPFDVDLLKVDIPAHATPDTPWELTRQARERYYDTTRPERSSWEEPGVLNAHYAVDLEALPKDCDIYALLVKQVVSVTPLSLDMTSRVDLQQLNKLLHQDP